MEEFGIGITIQNPISPALEFLGKQEMFLQLLILGSKPSQGELILKGYNTQKITREEGFNVLF